MKKYYFLLVTMLCMAFTSMCFMACGSDDDDDEGGGGGGSTNTTINGQDISYPYGYYAIEGNVLELIFTNWSAEDQKNGKIPSILDHMSIDVVLPSVENSGIPTGEFTNFHVYVVHGTYEELQKGGSGGQQYEGRSKDGKVKLTITRNGDTYNVAYSKLSIGTDKISFSNSFNWSGTLQYAPGSMLK